MLRVVSVFSFRSTASSTKNPCLVNFCGNSLIFFRSLGFPEKCLKQVVFCKIPEVMASHGTQILQIADSTTVSRVICSLGSTADLLCCIICAHRNMGKNRYLILEEIPSLFPCWSLVTSFKSFQLLCNRKGILALKNTIQSFTAEATVCLYPLLGSLHCCTLVRHYHSTQHVS